MHRSRLQAVSELYTEDAQVIPPGAEASDRWHLFRDIWNAPAIAAPTRP